MPYGTNKPKVLFILHLPPPIHGAGVVGQAIKLSKDLNDSFAATFINLSTTKSLADLRRKSIKKYLLFLKLAWTVFRTLRKDKFDLCYVTLNSKGIGFYKDLLIIFVIRLFKVRLIYHFHNKGVKPASKRKINDSLYLYVFRNASLILLSPNVYEDVEKYISRDHVYYCPNGISPISIEVRNERSPATTCRILFLSNMMSEKGVYVLIEALKHLAAKQIPFSCDFVGDWSDISEDLFNTKIASANLEKLVRAHGPKYGTQKEFYFHQADIFVFPTLNETFGLVNLEAMNHRLPIVGSREGAISDIISDGQTGYLIEKGNHTELAERLEMLINNPAQRIKMGNAGHDRLCRFYTMEIFEENLVKILWKVLDSGIQKPRQAPKG